MLKRWFTSWFRWEDVCAVCFVWLGGVLCGAMQICFGCCVLMLVGIIGSVMCGGGGI